MKSRPFPAAAVLVLLLAGCAANDPLAEQYQDGSGQGYISGDGTLEVAPAQRGEPIPFAGEGLDGQVISSEDYAGEVVVLNFWYANCPPCRVEAPTLAQLSAEYDEVAFLGVNTSDDTAVARLFEQENGIAYPSILDARTASVQLAFAGSGAVAPNAVPTTLVLDREGRVAARISGVIKDASILASMLDTVLAQ
ncbi:MAG: TlpA family protein disulfide reductase [Solirubrobacteraceae bacterium]